MPRNCSVCENAKHSQIDRDLLEKKHGYRAVAKRYRLHPSAVYRHFRSHLPGFLLQAKQAHEVLDATRLVDRLQSLHRETSEILAQARKAKDLKTALQAIQRAENQIGLVNMLATSMPAAGPQLSPELQKQIGVALCEYIDLLRAENRSKTPVVEVFPPRDQALRLRALPAPAQTSEQGEPAK